MTRGLPEHTRRRFTRIHALLLFVALGVLAAALRGVLFGSTHEPTRKETTDAGWNGAFTDPRWERGFGSAPPTANDVDRGADERHALDPSMLDRPPAVRER